MHQLVGKRNHPLQAMLSKYDADPEVVHQPRQGGQDFFGSSRVKGAGGLVEHQQSRMHGEYGANRHPLLLSARQRAHVSTTQIGDPEEV